MSYGDIEIKQTALFIRQKKKFHQNEREAIDVAVRDVIHNPRIGEEKRADLNGMWVHKFKIHRQEYLLAYWWDERTRTFISVGVHENFYRDVKKYLG